MSDEPWNPTATMPTLLRQAQQTYSDAMRAVLAREGYDDIPVNGLFIIGGLARRDGVPIGRLVTALGITKQGAGQLVDTLVTRGYLERTPDPHDRRRLMVTLTPRGLTAAELQISARRALDEALETSVGATTVETARRALAALIDLRLDVGARKAGMSADQEFENRRLNGAVFRNCAMARARFEDIDLSESNFVDVNLRGVVIRNANLSGAVIDDAKIRGLTIAGNDVEALIRAYNAESGRRGEVRAPALAARAPRAFLPTRDFAASVAFYETVGFAKLLDGEVAIFSSGPGEFILQRRYDPVWAENCMMQLMVDDLDAWWTHIETLDLPGRFGVTPPRAPAMQPWGLRVAYVFDPAGVLWHIAQRRPGESAD